ncbi:hypothetical protein HPC62_13485 [Thermoleptolyngbya sichuanensis A183]|uniref:Uncharacterized protein n=1 Tax=Thermoleptolyngbya sichuanensis A183 TaxID=2737172 RepID=A0A6M8BFP6_9CYAN|nr:MULTISPECIES: hypothetical protein [Thermoleptolyngbya]QKD83070.1 hypothetical protein HPC62_13485 [Thermoleptolyngbya sichuanensis A183]
MRLINGRELGASSTRAMQAEGAGAIWDWLGWDCLGWDCLGWDCLGWDCLGWDFPDWARPSLSSNSPTKDRRLACQTKVLGSLRLGSLRMKFTVKDDGGWRAIALYVQIQTQRKCGLGAILGSRSCC